MNSPVTAKATVDGWLGLGDLRLGGRRFNLDFLSRPLFVFAIGLPAYGSNDQKKNQLLH